MPIIHLLNIIQVYRSQLHVFEPVITDFHLFYLDHFYIFDLSGDASRLYLYAGCLCLVSCQQIVIDYGDRSSRVDNGFSLDTVYLERGN